MKFFLYILVILGFIRKNHIKESFYGNKVFRNSRRRQIKENMRHNPSRKNALKLMFRLKFKIFKRKEEYNPHNQS